jgi:hypothetical protein
MKARAALPATCQETPGRFGESTDALVAAVVVMVRVAVPAVAPLMETGLVDPKFNVGRF